ncbi:MAG: hypothetical protein AAFQ94_16015 [Bacteroidota bacterium]
MKRILLILSLFLSLSVSSQAQQFFSNPGIRIGGSTSTWNWRIYRSNTGSFNQSLLFANVGATANVETIRARLTQWGGLSLGGTYIASSDLLSVNGDARVSGDLILPLLSNQSGVITLKGEASDNASIHAEQYGSGTGSRLKFQVGNDPDDYFSFVHNHYSLDDVEVLKISRSNADLAGDFQVSQMGHFKGWTSNGLTGLGLDIGIANGIGNIMTYDRTNAQYHNMRLTARAGGDKGLFIHTNGNFGIDIVSPSHKLTVNGSIRSKEIECEFDNWPDYVFEDSYELKSLDEVSQFIAANGHLPNIPSAQEVENNGVKLTEMSAGLLEKVEELTLYTIDQDKKLASQTQQISEQKDQLQKQEALIQSLIERIENLEK